MNLFSMDKYSLCLFLTISVGVPGLCDNILMSCTVNCKEHTRPDLLQTLFLTEIKARLVCMLHWLYSKI